MTAERSGRSARRVPSYRDCRAAARSIHRAEFAREAIATVRPRGSYHFHRSRAPLPIVLYLAARDGLLVWRGPDSLALLAPPGSRRSAVAGRGPWIWFLRAVDWWWEFLMIGVPAFVGFLVTFLVAGFAQAMPADSIAHEHLLLLTLILGLLVVLYLLVSMVAGPVWQAVRAFGRRQTEDEIAADMLPVVSWSMPLCHQSVPDRADELLRAVSLRLDRMVIGPAVPALAGLGAVARDVESAETLVCLRSGITTRHMRDTVEEWVGHVPPSAPGAAVAVKLATTRPRGVPRRILGRGEFLFIYLLAMAAYIGAFAAGAASHEAEACAATGCDGRPATYPSALRWMAQRVFLTDPPGLAPATAIATAAGWFVSFMSVVGFAVLHVSIVDYARYRRRFVDEFNDRRRVIGQRSRVLILVATEVERDAVFGVARDITGREPTPRHLPHHTVYALGQLGEAEVLLAETQPGAVGPGGAAITAAALISRLAPDYLVVTGICFGLRRDEQSLGDIVVSRQLRAIDHRKVTDTQKDGTRLVLTRGDYVSASLTLFDRFRAAQVGWDRCRVHYGTMLSSSTLVNSEELCRELLELDPEARGGEMEGAGVYAAAAPEKVDWIVVKAISDWGYDKGDDMQPTAAANVAAFVLETIRSGALDEPVRPPRSS